jgi:chaperone required for assembly of F1-ATPase
VHNVFQDIFAEALFDPTEAARRAVRPSMRRRFYAHAHVLEQEGSFSVVLDGRPARTPARRPLAAPAQPLGRAIAEEWEHQRDFIDPATMPVTRLANSIIDGVTAAPTAVPDAVRKYLETDLVCYRAEGPPRLIARQAAAWDPVLFWAREGLGAAFSVSPGMVFVGQSPAALAAASAAVPRNPWRLGAVHTAATLTGSALLALALAGGALSLETAWAAAHVDEDWNSELWGRDALATHRRAFRFTEMQAAALVLEAVPGD